jgi:predicted transcriptional regulator
MEIYNDDILSAINLELTNGEAKPTRVQTLSNLAYDKLVRYLNELEGKKMMMITQERRTLIFRPYHHKQHHQHDNWCYMVCAKRKG